HSVFYATCVPRSLHSFPTRRSSDLQDATRPGAGERRRQHAVHGAEFAREPEFADELVPRQRLARQLPARGKDAERNRQVEAAARSEEHTSELQSRENLVCRLLLGKK